MKTPAKMTDPELYALCKKWGAEALEARRKFIGLLPEVYKRRLYERRNFQSIFHFAAQLGGVSRPLVENILRLEKRYEEMPNLHKALVNGEIGLSKLVRIASVAEVGNEADLCEKIRTLSRRAVDVLVKDMQASNNNNGLFKVENDLKSLFGQNFDFEILAKLSPEVKVKLKELIDKEIDINAILLKTFAEREGGIAEQMAEIGSAPAKSRHIPIKIKKIIKEEFGNKCSFWNCKNPAEIIHHEKHFAHYRNHDPRHLKPLCRGHHELEHVR